MWCVGKGTVESLSLPRSYAHVLMKCSYKRLKGGCPHRCPGEEPRWWKTGRPGCHYGPEFWSQGRFKWSLWPQGRYKWSDHLPPETQDALGPRSLTELAANVLALPQ